MMPDQINLNGEVYVKEHLRRTGNGSMTTVKSYPRRKAFTPTVKEVFDDYEQFEKGIIERKEDYFDKDENVPPLFTPIRMAVEAVGNHVSETLKTTKSGKKEQEVQLLPGVEGWVE